MLKAIRSAIIALSAGLALPMIGSPLCARPAAAAVYTWTGGGGANTNWSEGANWGGSGPANDEIGVELVFPALAAPYRSNNDRTGLQVTSVSVATQVGNGTYTITGNPIVLRGPVAVANPGTGQPNLIWQIPVGLGEDVVVTTSGRQTRLQGTIDLSSRTLTFEAMGDVLLSGVVSGAGNIVKNGFSALTLTANNTYGGTTTNNGGALYIDSAAALGDSAVGTVINGGSLGFAGRMFTTSEPVTFHGGGIFAYGRPSMLGAVTLDATVAARVFAQAQLRIAGPVSGSGGIDKRDPGLLVLESPSISYTGSTSVSAGTLRLDSDLASANSLLVANGGTLMGNGSTAGQISVQSGGTIAPGDSPGELASGGLTMAAGAVFSAEINGPNPVTDYDRVAANGPVDLGGATLAIALADVPGVGSELTLIAQQQDRAVTGTFADLAEGAELQVGGTSFTITYRGNAGNDVVLVAGPTSSTATPIAATPTPIPTATGSPLPTAPATASPLAENTPTQAATPSPTATSVLSPTPGPSPCTGDCDDSGTVGVSELVRAVNIALAKLPPSACPPADPNGDGQVSIGELIQAVGKALSGC